VRTAAKAAHAAVAAMVLAHRESASFAPFNGISYRDAAGPTTHAPANAKQVDPWAPEISETANAFWTDTGEDKLARALA
jgi:hypothetical protein